MYVVGGVVGGGLGSLVGYEITCDKIFKSQKEKNMYIVSGMAIGLVISLLLAFLIHYFFSWSSVSTISTSSSSLNVQQSTPAPIESLTTIEPSLSTTIEPSQSTPSIKSLTDTNDMQNVRNQLNMFDIFSRPPSALND